MAEVFGTNFIADQVKK